MEEELNYNHKNCNLINRGCVITYQDGYNSYTVCLDETSDIGDIIEHFTKMLYQAGWQLETIHQGLREECERVEGELDTIRMKHVKETEFAK